MTMVLACLGIVACSAAGAAKRAPVDPRTAHWTYMASEDQSGYMYAGCRIFPGTPGGSGGGWFDTDISKAPEDPSSSMRIKAYYDALRAGRVDQGFNLWTVNWSNGPFVEFINWANNRTPLVPVHGNPHPVDWKMPWSNVFQSEIPAGADRHAIVFNTDTCTDYELFAAHWNGYG